MRTHLVFRAALVGVATMALASAASAREYIYGSYLPPKHNVNVEGLAPLFKELKPIVDWKLVTGGQLFSGAATLKSVGNGTADAGVVIPAYVQSALKNAFLSMDMMFVADDPMVLNAAVLDTFFNDCPQCLNDYHKSNTVLLSTYAVGGWSLLCRGDVKSLADVKGKRIRTTGALGRFAIAMGGSPQAMDSGEMIEAISRGQLDCILGAFAWLKDYPIADSIKSIYALRKGATAVDLFVMNRDSWKSLSKAQQMAMLKAMPGAIARVTVEGYMGSDLKAAALAKSKHIPVYHPDKTFNDMYRKFQKKELGVVIERAKKRGAKDPAQIVAAIQKNEAKWEKIIGKEDRSDLKALTARYEKLLWEHIYSKLDPAKI